MANGTLFFWNRRYQSWLLDVLITFRKIKWFKHDGATAHFSAEEPTFLITTFGTRQIERVGPVPWPIRFPNLSLLDFWFGEIWRILFLRLHITQIRISLIAYPKLLHVCMKYLASLNVYAGRSSNAVKHVLLQWTQFWTVIIKLSFLSSVIALVCSSQYHLHPDIQIQ